MKRTPQHLDSVDPEMARFPSSPPLGTPTFSSDPGQPPLPPPTAQDVGSLLRLAETKSSMRINKALLSDSMPKGAVQGVHCRLIVTKTDLIFVEISPPTAKKMMAREVQQLRAMFTPLQGPPAAAAAGTQQQQASAKNGVAPLTAKTASFTEGLSVFVLPRMAIMSMELFGTEKGTERSTFSANTVAPFGLCITTRNVKRMFIALHLAGSRANVLHPLLVELKMTHFSHAAQQLQDKIEKEKMILANSNLTATTTADSGGSQTPSSSNNATPPDSEANEAPPVGFFQQQQQQSSSSFAIAKAVKEPNLFTLSSQRGAAEVALWLFGGSTLAASLPATILEHVLSRVIRLVEGGGERCQFWAMGSMEEELQERQGISEQWRITTANSAFSHCETYPPTFGVPSSVNDEQVVSAAKTRSIGRLQALTYYHPPTGGCICRSSQQLAGEQFYSYLYATAGGNLTEAIRKTCTSKSMVVFDMRPFTSALANVVGGGAYEIRKESIDVKFSNIENIHTVRGAFTGMCSLVLEQQQQYREALAAQAAAFRAPQHAMTTDVPMSPKVLFPSSANNLLEAEATPQVTLITPSTLMAAMAKTKWLDHVFSLLNAAVEVAVAVAGGCPVSPAAYKKIELSRKRQQQVPRPSSSAQLIGSPTSVMSSPLRRQQVTPVKPLSAAAPRSLSRASVDSLDAAAYSHFRPISPNHNHNNQQQSSSSPLHDADVRMLLGRGQRNAKATLVHCSDGWDRTSQVCALSQLLLDPFTRTLKGFVGLVEKDFIMFGHKFRDRSNFAIGSEKQSSPIFMQFLDAVRHLMDRYPCAFEFDESFLRFLLDLLHSGVCCNFGPCNNVLELHELLGFCGSYSGSEMRGVSLWQMVSAVLEACSERHLPLGPWANPMFDKDHSAESLLLLPISPLCATPWSSFFFQGAAALGLLSPEAVKAKQSVLWATGSGVASSANGSEPRDGGITIGGGGGGAAQSVGRSESDEGSGSAPSPVGMPPPLMEQASVDSCCGSPPKARSVGRIVVPSVLKGLDEDFE